MVTDAEDGFALMASREDGAWQVGLLPERLRDDLDGLIAALRQQAGDVGGLGLVDVAGEFFVALRVRGPEVRLLVSDVSAALVSDLARDVVHRLGLDQAGEEALDLDEDWPAGDLSLFADLGLDEVELGAVLSNTDAYVEEALASIADRLGFGAAFRRAVDAVSH